MRKLSKKRNRPAGKLAKVTQLKLNKGGIKKANSELQNKIDKSNSDFFINEDEIDPKDRTLTLEEVQAELSQNGHKKYKLSNLKRVTEGLYIGSKKTPEHLWQEKFFYNLQQTGSIKKACEYAEVSRFYLEQYRKGENPEAKEFNELVRLCKEDYLEQLEEEADRRGYKGFHEEVIYKGTRTGIFVRRYSDFLLSLRLKAESPKYREGGVNVNVDNRKQVVLAFTDDDEMFQIE